MWANTHTTLQFALRKKNGFTAFIIKGLADRKFQIGLNNIYSGKVHDIHKYNVKIIGSDCKPVAYLDHLLDML